MRTNLLVPGAVLAALVAAACGHKSKPVQISEPVGIHLHVRSQDVSGTVLSSSKNINTEAGNPFGKFVTDAQTALNGADPSHVEVSSLTLDLVPGGSSTALPDIFSGVVAISFVMNSGSNAYPAATVASVSGTSATMSATFDSAAMSPADYTGFLGGQFKVMVEGTANPGYDNGSQDDDLLATFGFAAFK